MENEEKVTQDPTDNIENEGEHLENQEEGSEESEEKTLQSLQKQKEHWRNKAKGFEAELNTLKEPKKEVEKKETPKAIEGDTGLISHEDYTDIKLEYPYLDKDDIYKASRWAKAEGENVHEVIKSGWFKSYADTKYAEIKSKNATPRPGSRAGSVSGIDIDAIKKDPTKYRELSDKQKELVRKQIGWQ